MKSFHQMKPFKKDIKLINKRRYNLSLLVQVLNLLSDGDILQRIIATTNCKANGRAGVNVIFSLTGS